MSLVSLLGSPKPLNASLWNVLKHPATLVTIGATVGFYVRHAYAEQSQTILTTCNNWLRSKFGYAPQSPTVLTPAITTITSSTGRDSIGPVKSKKNLQDSVEFRNSLKNLKDLKPILSSLSQDLDNNSTSDIHPALLIPRTIESAESAIISVTTTTAIVRPNSIEILKQKATKVREEIEQVKKMTIKISDNLGTSIINMAYELCQNADTQYLEVIQNIPTHEQANIRIYFGNIAEQTNYMDINYANIVMWENEDPVKNQSKINTAELAIDAALTAIMNNFSKLVKYVNRVHIKHKRTKVQGIFKLTE